MDIMPAPDHSDEAKSGPPIGKGKGNLPIKMGLSAQVLLTTAITLYPPFSVKLFHLN
jgi:hypothetical protein